MNTSLRSLHALLFAAVFIAFVSAAARAANDAKTSPPPQGEARGTISQQRGQQRITINFTGGSVADLVALLNKIDAPGFNLIGEKEDLATPLPPFSLRDVSPNAFAMGLRQILEPRGITVMAEGNEMFVLRRLGTLRSPALEPQRFESFQLASYLEKQSIDDIVGAIRAAWELNPQNKPDALQLKFHPPTKLLLVSGSGEAVMIASKVISTLSGAPDKNSGEPHPAPAPKR
jgi:hypothetical protein